MKDYAKQSDESIKKMPDNYLLCKKMILFYLARTIHHNEVHYLKCSCKLIQYSKWNFRGEGARNK